MKRVLSITTALLLLGSTAAMAQGYGYHGSYNNYRGYGDHDRGGNIAGAAIGAGILGFALGALATSQNHHYYGNSGYGYGGYAVPSYGSYGTRGYGYGGYAAPAYRYAAPAYGYGAPGYGYGAPGYGYGGSSLSLGFGF